MVHVTLNTLNGIVVYFSDPSMFKICRVAISHPSLVTIKCSISIVSNLQEEEEEEEEEEELRLRIPPPIITLNIIVIKLYGNYTYYLH
jgi:hypothetical protein